MVEFGALFRTVGLSLAVPPHLETANCALPDRNDISNIQIKEDQDVIVWLITVGQFVSRNIFESRRLDNHHYQKVFGC